MREPRNTRKGAKKNGKVVVSTAARPCRHEDRVGEMRTTSRIVCWMTMLGMAAVLLGALPLARPPFLARAGAQLHPPEIRAVYPLGGSPGATTRVTISGISFRSADRILFDPPGVTAKILPADLTKLP